MNFEETCLIEKKFIEIDFPLKSLGKNTVL